MATPKPIEEVKYKVVELGTSGWCVNDPKQDVGLNKEQARERLNFYMNVKLLHENFHMK